MSLERPRPEGRRTDVDDGNYIDLFLDEGYEDELAREDPELDKGKWWPEALVDWTDSQPPGPDSR